MPYPAQIDLDTILETARGLIEESGVDALSLGRLAADLGVKAPSLYRHVANKDALIQGVSTQLVTRLFEEIEPALAAAGDAPEDRAQGGGEVHIARLLMPIHAPLCWQ